MKLALITDCHWGIRNDNVVITSNTEKFLSEIFFPEIDKREINTIIHLGDLVDRRKYINFQTANKLRHSFIEPIIDRNLDFHFILGNHDVYFKGSNQLNSITELYNMSPNFYIYDKATEVDFDGIKVLFVPWICDENRTETFTKIRETNAQICFGHLDLCGPEEQEGHPSNHGDDPENFSKFDYTYSGHFHHRSVYNNIHYLGSPAQFSWSDYGGVRGFHIFDTETRSLEFIQNPINTFRKFYYDDSVDKMNDIDYEEYKGCYVKVIVVKKTNAYNFENMIEKFEKSGVIDLKIIENIIFDTTDANLIINDSESTLDIFNNYIRDIETDVDKSKITNTIHALYAEALNLGIEE